MSWKHILPFKVDSFQKVDKNKFDRFASLKSASIPLKYLDIMASYPKILTSPSANLVVRNNGTMATSVDPERVCLPEYFVKICSFISGLI